MPKKVVNEDGTSATVEPVEREITVRGVALKVDPNIFDDLDLLDALDQIQEGNGLRIAGALRKVAGGQYNALRAALRDPKTGRIPVDEAGSVFVEIMQELVPNS